MNKLKKMAPYFLIQALIFYLLPLLIQDTASAMFLLLLLIPGLSLVLSFVYGSRHSFHWQYGLVVGLLFLPTLFIFYNESAVIYLAVYGGLALLGNFLGSRLGSSR